MNVKRLVNPETGEILDPHATPEYYTLDAIRHADIWTPENIKSEYTRLRKIAQERLREMSKSPIGRESYTFKRNQGRFRPASELTTGQMKVQLSEVARMITARRGTLAGIKRARKQAIATFHEHGYDFVTEENYSEFGEFMRAWKDSRFRGYGSMVAVDFFESALSATGQDVDAETFKHAKVSTRAESRVVAEAFRDWMNDIERFEETGLKTNSKQVTSVQLLEDWRDYLK